jgi:hypothetical protein
MQLEPQFLHSYLSPFAKPGVSQVILQVGHVVNGRLGFTLRGIELSVRISALTIRKDAGERIRANT